MNTARFKTKEPKEEQRTTKFSWMVLGFMLSAMVLFGFGYIREMNKATGKGYAIKALEKKIVQLRDTNSKLSAEAAELGSMKTVSEKVKTMYMTEVGSVEFVKRDPGEVAVR